MGRVASSFAVPQAGVRRRTQCEAPISPRGRGDCKGGRGAPLSPFTDAVVSCSAKHKVNGISHPTAKNFGDCKGARPLSPFMGADISCSTKHPVNGILYSEQHRVIHPKRPPAAFVVIQRRRARGRAVVQRCALSPNRGVVAVEQVFHAEAQLAHRKLVAAE